MSSPIVDVRERRRAPARKAQRGGRPSRSDALLLGDKILEAATELFLEEGFGAASIEAVAARAGISKRTFYHRFADKTALFVAVVQRIIEQIRPPREVPLLEGATLHDILRRLAGFMLHAALAPRAIALHRLISAESARFPELARAVYDQGWSEAIALIANLLARELHDAHLTPELRTFAAQQFIHMVVALPQRRALMLGAPLSAKELERWADDVVRLFLEGCRRLAAP